MQHPHQHASSSTLTAQLHCSCDLPACDLPACVRILQLQLLCRIRHARHAPQTCPSVFMTPAPFTAVLTPPPPPSTHAPRLPDWTVSGLTWASASLSCLRIVSAACGAAWRSLTYSSTSTGVAISAVAVPPPPPAAVCVQMCVVANMYSLTAYYMVARGWAVP